MVFLVLGLVMFGLGEALLVTAGVGVSPWTVFAEGVTEDTFQSVLKCSGLNRLVAS